MSIKIALVTAALAVAASASFGSGQALADTCNGTWQQYGRAKVQCYYLPTVSNGRVTGVERHENVERCRQVPIYASNGHMVGFRPICT